MEKNNLYVYRNLRTLEKIEIEAASLRQAASMLESDYYNHEDFKMVDFTAFVNRVFKTKRNNDKYRKTRA
jgi:hypothetical protein